ncbi:twin-arginine translocase TatA/TatE family subunit [Actinocrispum wychmicini]|uniref:Sec-independent protein translocase protein TatB n=1 Tax=Actinocrispum wychmicini TaxID=1213861 RepID=A0A4R2J234_9PSEU|nr:twin-arginine translocase TatA/TatE family subunit [Actinocrispum wychmicini]TCO52301.1 sec-independent protein translocase protein TatB [Actinocrispum wychmicini]
MVNLSLEHMLILLLAALFILGPDRLPGAARTIGRTIRKVREYATTTRDQLKSEMGPEFDELRRPLQDLAALRSFNPRSAVTNYLFDDTTAKTPTVPQPTAPSERAPVDLEAT